jgi:hypothetical protein
VKATRNATNSNLLIFVGDVGGSTAPTVNMRSAVFWSVNFTLWFCVTWGSVNKGLQKLLPSSG